jgi:hypothetical protein
MHKDFTLDDKKVLLPNASTLGFGRHFAKRGDWLVFREQEGGILYYGRSVGHVVCESKHWIYAAALLSDLQGLMVRWVDPALVTYCLPQEHTRSAVADLMGCDFSKLENIRTLLKPHMSTPLSFGDKDK